MLISDPVCEQQTVEPAAGDDWKISRLTLESLSSLCQMLSSTVALSLGRRESKEADSNVGESIVGIVVSTLISSVRAYVVLLCAKVAYSQQLCHCSYDKGSGYGHVS